MLMTLINSYYVRYISHKNEYLCNLQLLCSYTVLCMAAWMDREVRKGGLTLCRNLCQLEIQEES